MPRTMNLTEPISDTMIRFLYNEMTEEESSDFLAFLNKNTSAKQEFLALQKSAESLCSIEYTPGESVMYKVKTYASFNMINPQ